MEPALHIDMRLVLQGPLRPGAHADGDGQEIGGEGDRNGKESDDSAEFGAAGEFIEEDEADEDDQEHPPLGESVFAIDVEKHRGLVFRYNLCGYRLQM